MAFVSFYLIAGGTGSADINAGSTIGAATGGPTTNGNWNATTGVFIAASGTPFATTTTADYASVYVDGGTVTTFVGAVTTVTSSTQITIDVTTIKYGTAPSTSATARSCVIGGSWNTEQVLAAGGLATFTIPQATKINMKGNLTLTASRTVSMAGTTLLPLWFSCYNTTPGDLDNDTTNSLAKPIWTINATFLLTSSGAHQLWSSLSVVGNRSGSVWSAAGGNTNQQLLRCRVENTSSNAAAATITVGTNARYLYSWFKAPTTATTIGVVNAAATNTTYVGCVAEGGGLAGWNVSTGAAFFVNCISLNNVGAGILGSTATLYVTNHTVYGATVDGIKWSSTPGAGSFVVGSLFSGLNGSTATTNGINNASGTNSAYVTRLCNDYYNVTNAEVGFGDSPAFFGQTDSNPVVTSATNFTPVATSNAIAHGFPGIVENETFSNFVDIGAVQPRSGSGGLFIQ